MKSSIHERVLFLYDLAAAIPPADAGHDFSHIERVSKLAVRLFDEEIRIREQREMTEDEHDAIYAAALLHDCVPVAKNSPLRKESSRLASEKAKEILDAQKSRSGDRCWSRDWVSEITEAIHDHSFSSGRSPRSLLGECLQDADRLEALGAIGLYRTIATGVSMGAKLFHPTDPWAESRELDDRSFSIDHFFTKLLKLPASFRTKAGQKEALLRAGYLQGFVEQLKKEID
jgi:uncharacterized protein